MRKSLFFSCNTEVNSNSKRNDISDDELKNTHVVPYAHGQLGVYSLENPQTPEAASQRLAISHKLCLSNARVCSDLGAVSKADTWLLLAQAIESIMIYETDETDGFGGEGDALTTGVVEHILQFYECNGDYQMLSR